MICDIKTSLEANSGAIFKSTVIVGINFTVKQRLWKIKSWQLNVEQTHQTQIIIKMEYFTLLNQVWKDSEDRWVRLSMQQKFGDAPDEVLILLMDEVFQADRRMGDTQTDKCHRLRAVAG